MSFRLTILLLLLPLQMLGQYNNLIPYRKGKLWGYCDSNKNMALPYVYGEVEAHHYWPDVHQLRKIYGTEGRVGLFDGSKKQIILDTVYENIELMQHLILAKRDGHYGTYDFNGNKIQDPGFASFGSDADFCFAPINGASYYCHKDDSFFHIIPYTNLRSLYRYVRGEKEGRTYFLKWKNHLLILADTLSYKSVEAFNNRMILAETGKGQLILLDTFLNSDNTVMRDIMNNAFYYIERYGNRPMDFIQYNDNASIERYVKKMVQPDKYRQAPVINNRLFFQYFFTANHYFYTDKATGDGRYPYHYRQYYSFGKKYPINNKGWTQDSAHHYVYLSDWQPTLKTPYTKMLHDYPSYETTRNSEHRGLYFLYENNLNDVCVYRSDTLLKAHFNSSDFKRGIQFMQRIDDYRFWVKDSSKARFYVRSVLGDSSNSYADTTLKMVVKKVRDYYINISNGYLSFEGYNYNTNQYIRLSHALKNDTVQLTPEFFSLVKMDTGGIILNVLGDTILKFRMRFPDISTIDPGNQSSIYLFSFYDEAVKEQIFFNPWPVRVKRVKTDNPLTILLNGTFYYYQKNNRRKTIRGYRWHFSSFILDSNRNIIEPLKDFNLSEKGPYYYPQKNLILTGGSYEKPILVQLSSDGRFSQNEQAKELEGFSRPDIPTYYSGKHKGKYYIINSWGETGVLPMKSSIKVKDIKIENFWNTNPIFLVYTKHKIFIYNKDYKLILESGFKDNAPYIEVCNNQLFYFSGSDKLPSHYFDSKGTLYYEP